MPPDEGHEKKDPAIKRDKPKEIIEIPEGYTWSHTRNEA